MIFGRPVGDRRRDWDDLMVLPPSTHPPMMLVAGETLPRGASVHFQLTEGQKIALDQGQFKRCPSSDAIPVEVFVRREDLYVPGVPESSWLSLLSFAEDVHSECARLSLSREGSVAGEGGPSLVLTLVKEARKGDLLPFWFCSDLASRLGMPFLTFGHVKDGSYTCPNCSKKFDSPNPLKLHLASACDMLSSSFLWERLWSALPSLLSPWETPRLTFRRKETSSEAKSDLCRGLHLMTLSKGLHEEAIVSYPFSRSILSQGTESSFPDSTSQDRDLGVTKPSHGSENKSVKYSELATRRPKTLIPHSLSAFKPVVGTSHQDLGTRELDEISSLPQNFREKSYFTTEDSSRGLLPTSSRHSLPILASLPKNPLLNSAHPSHLWSWPRISLPSSPSSLPPCSSSSLPFLPPSLSGPLPSTSSGDPALDMETLVSSLGRGKGNHLCLYCGKVYSRKYGLKIHIRTHTGYKPLKCRVCLRPFGDPSNLNKHIRLHAQGETPYRCDLCGKVLVRKRDLDRHVRSRHPKAPLSKLPAAPSTFDYSQEARRRPTSTTQQAAISSDPQ